MRPYAVLALLLLCGTVPRAQTKASIPQGWMSRPVTDPATHQAYTAYANTGHLLNENIDAHISILCVDGKPLRSIFTVDGMTFHEDSYMAQQTYVAIKVGSEVESKGLSLSEDFKQAGLDSKELKMMFKSLTPVIQFSDDSGTKHYAAFDLSNPPPSFSTDCKQLAHK